MDLNCCQLREIHGVHEEKIFSLTAGDNGNFFSARLVKIIAYFL